MEIFGNVVSVIGDDAVLRCTFKVHLCCVWGVQV